MSTTRARLYDLADEFYRVAPWKWMREDQLIALRRPSSDEIDHISIMGAAGDHHCLALYLGEEGRHRFNLLQESDVGGIELSDEDTIGLILSTPQLQAAYTGRRDIYPSELRIIKTLGRKYRGENWPYFRTFRPGYSPEPVDDAAAALLADAIEQALVIAPDLQKDSFGDCRENPQGGRERITRERGKDGIWRTVWTPDDMRYSVFPEPEPSELFVAKIAELPTSGLHLECQFQLLTNPISESGETAVFPYLAMSVDAASGFVFGVDLLSVEAQSHDDLIASVPDTFLKGWGKHNIRPASIRVHSEFTRTLLRKTAKALDIPLHRENKLPQLDKALQSMMQMMEG